MRLWVGTITSNPAFTKKDKKGKNTVKNEIRMHLLTKERIVVPTGNRFVAALFMLWHGWLPTHNPDEDSVLPTITIDVGESSRPPYMVN